jgi:cytochrome c oxidase cbb3-type subunit III
MMSSMAGAARLLVLFTGLGGLLSSQTATSNTPKPDAQKSGPPIPPGTGGPGGTSRVEQMAKFLAIGDAPDPAAVARGKTFFVATCGFCHGANANGGESGPDLIRSVLVLHDENGDKIGPVIRGGRPGKGMPAFASITQEQISDIAAFLKSRYQAAANRASYQIQNINTGDPEKGKAYFNGAGRCNTCHSATGDLAGIANRYSPDGLQSRFLYPRPVRSSDNPGEKPTGAVTKVTVTLPSGQTVSGTLDHLDDFNVALIDASGNYQSWRLGENSNIKVSLEDPLAAHLELLKTYTNADMHNILAYLETLK